MCFGVLDDLARDLAADVADLALEVADAGFARVVADDVAQGVVGEADLLFGEAGGFALLLDQVLLGDLELFDLGVAGEAEDFHAVLQRAGDGVEDVGRGDEEHLREVVLDVEVVVLEGVVLLGVEHFEQGTRRGRRGSPRPSCRSRRA